MVLNRPMVAVALHAQASSPEPEGNLLELLVRTANRDAAEDERLDPSRISMHAVRVGRRNGVILRPPPPQFQAEAFLCAVVQMYDADDPPADRSKVQPAYFVLEYSPVRPPPHTLFSRWTLDENGRAHLNLGAGPAPDVASFAAHIETHLNVAP